jgi:hypothetical protein
MGHRQKIYFSDNAGNAHTTVTPRYVDGVTVTLMHAAGASPGSEW